MTIEGYRPHPGRIPSFGSRALRAVVSPSGESKDGVFDETSFFWKTIGTVVTIDGGDRLFTENAASARFFGAAMIALGTTYLAQRARDSYRLSERRYRASTVKYVTRHYSVPEEERPQVKTVKEFIEEAKLRVRPKIGEPKEIVSTQSGFSAQLEVDIYRLREKLKEEITFSRRSWGGGYDNVDLTIEVEDSQATVKSVSSKEEYMREEDLQQALELMRSSFQVSYKR